MFKGDKQLSGGPNIPATPWADSGDMSPHWCRFSAKRPRGQWGERARERPWQTKRL